MVICVKIIATEKKHKKEKNKVMAMDKGILQIFQGWLKSLCQ